MIKKVDSERKYIDFINEINSDSNFSSPMLCTDEQMKSNLFDTENKKGHHIFGVFKEQELIGLFVFVIIEDENYIEMIVGLSKNPKAYEEILAFLKTEYKGYNIDFVYNPRNYILHRLLENEKAEFDVEQQKMILKNEVVYCSNCQVELYSPKYREQYSAMHSIDTYWTADKVIASTDIFRVILAIEKDDVVGYLDITHKYDENEPYDILVKPEYRRKGYGKAMLAKAIELNKPNSMMLLVDVDNVGAIALYESLGFEKVLGENSITAYLSL